MAKKNNKKKTAERRRLLLDLAKGQRSGYWVEVLHSEEDGKEGYILHTPAESLKGRHWTDKPALPATWEAIKVKVAKHIGADAKAEALPKYDEKRTYKGDILPACSMAALMKWANI